MPTVAPSSSAVCMSSDSRAHSPWGVTANTSSCKADAHGWSTSSGLAWTMPVRVSNVPLGVMSKLMASRTMFRAGAFCTCLSKALSSSSVLMPLKGVIGMRVIR